MPIATSPQLTPGLSEWETVAVSESGWFVAREHENGWRGLLRFRSVSESRAARLRASISGRAVMCAEVGFTLICAVGGVENGVVITQNFYVKTSVAL
jgi:hypothetical protein